MGEREVDCSHQVRTFVVQRTSSLLTLSRPSLAQHPIAQLLVVEDAQIR